MWQKCPVCEGKGLVPYGFYNVNKDFQTYTGQPHDEQCRSCNGLGRVEKTILNIPIQ